MKVFEMKYNDGLKKVFEDNILCQFGIREVCDGRARRQRYPKHVMRNCVRSEKDMTECNWGHIVV